MTPRARTDVPPPLDPTIDLAPGGPERLLLMGPPGTGKTDAIRRQVVPAVLAAGASPEQILICSFTRAAAGEIRRRLAEDMHRRPDDLRQMCTTIHASAWRLLRETCKGDLPKVIGGQPLAALGETDVGSESLDGAAMRAWDLARHAMVPLEQVAMEVAPDYSLAELRAVVNDYERTKRESNQIDYCDMLVRALDIEPPQRLALIVDECQDSTPLMVALTNQWRSAAARVVEVGDPDQVVHEWAGVDPLRLPRLARDGYAVRRLARSRRVPRAAHALARDLIQQNVNRIDAPYEPAPRDGEVHETEFDEVVGEVAHAAGEGKSVKVLARSARLLGRYATALAEAGVPYEHERGSSPRTSGAASVARAVLDLRAGRHAAGGDALALARRLPAAVPGTYPDEVADTLKASGATTRRVGADDLMDAGADVSRVLAAPTDYAALRAVLGQDEGEHVAALLERSGFAGLQQIPRVTLTTMHAAKGREADLVVLDLDAPSRVRRGLADGVAAVEAERRVLYVGLTRTRNKLLLVRGARHDLGEELGLAPLRHAL